jgi:hypothetical protein
LVSADKGYTPLNLSDNIISDIVKPNIPDTKGVAMNFRWGGPDFNSTYLHNSEFNEFVCKLGFVWHEWAYECQKSPIYTGTS